MTIHDLLRHTSGITYDHTGNGLVQQLYQQSRLRSRKISNAEHAALVASLPLMCQPGAEWNYSRSTDILGRIIEIVSGKTLGAFLTERILAPLQMTETAFHTASENADRLAEAFATDPWNGDKVQLFNMLDRPVMESGGGGLEDFMKLDRPLVEEEAALFGSALRRVFDALPGGGRALIVGHSPMHEVAVYGLTGSVVPPISKGAGVLVVQDGDQFQLVAGPAVSLAEVVRK